MSTVATAVASAAAPAPPVRASALKGMPVVSVADGIKVGEVTDLAVDGRELRVFGLVLGGRDGPAILPFSAIRSLGRDAITIADADGVSRPGNAPGHALAGLGDLVGLPVVDAEGTVLGHLRELEVDRGDGRIVAVTAEHGGVLGLGSRTLTLLASHVRSLGPALVTVDAEPAA